MKVRHPITLRHLVSNQRRRDVTPCVFAACRSVLQSVEVRCSALQCVAVCWSVLQRGTSHIVCCSVLHSVAVCCSVLQCVAVCCSVLQCVAECCSVLRCAVVCCSVLQCVAVCAMPCSLQHVRSLTP